MDSGRGAAKADGAQGTPAKSHISPRIPVYEDEDAARMLETVTPPEGVGLERERARARERERERERGRKREREREREGGGGRER